MRKPPNEVMKAQLQKKIRFRLLMTAALDGELSLEEEREFQSFLLVSSACRREWNACKRLVTAIRRIRFAQPPEEVWDRYSINICNRIEKEAGV